MTKYNFINAKQQNILHPKTFEVPTDQELNNLTTGDIVKVCHNDERFWTLIMSVKGNTITASIDNDLIFEQPFERGSVIQFGKENIYDIYGCVKCGSHRIK